MSLHLSCRVILPVLLPCTHISVALSLYLRCLVLTCIAISLFVLPCTYICVVLYLSCLVLICRAISLSVLPYVYLCCLILIPKLPCPYLCCLVFICVVLSFPALTCPHLGCILYCPFLTRVALSFPVLTCPYLGCLSSCPVLTYVALSFATLTCPYAGSSSRGGDVTVYVWHKPTELAHSFLFCSCVYFSRYGSFSCISFDIFSKQLSAFQLCSSGLISVSLALSTMYLFMKVSFSPDITHSGWLRSKYQLTN